LRRRNVKKNANMFPALLGFALAFVWLVPLVWLIGTAFSKANFAMSLIPSSGFTLDNIAYVWRNVPFGKYPNPAILQEEKIRKASKLLQDVNISESNFSDVVKEAKEGDFIYFDPPYFPLSKTSSFTSYQKGVFLENEQRELARTFRELHRKGCFVMLSNSDSPFIHQLYQGFTITPVKARRAINCIGTKRGKISEVVVTNYS